MPFDLAHDLAVARVAQDRIASARCETAVRQLPFLAGAAPALIKLLVSKRAAPSRPRTRVHAAVPVPVALPRALCPVNVWPRAPPLSLGVAGCASWSSRRAT